MATGVNGGRRPNAGRPKKPPGEKLIKLELFVKPATKTAVEQVGKPRVIAMIEDALDVKQELQNEQDDQ